MGRGSVRLDKIAQEASSAVYKSSTNDFGSVDFYVRIDKKDQRIQFYSDPDLSNAVYVVDDTTGDDPIRDLPGVPRVALLYALSGSLKIMRSDVFPDIGGHTT